MKRLKRPKAQAGANKAKDNEIKVFFSNRDSVCGECGEKLGAGAWITLAGEAGALCLSCADLDHLVYLPSGSAALTRRAKNASALWTVVLRWSRARKQYERKGLLVESGALEQAEAQCLADDDARERRRQREAVRREAVDAEYRKQFAERVRALFPGCPEGREAAIAEHACQKYSGRVGRSAAAKELNKKMIDLAVAAHIRHAETGYDALLGGGMDREAARNAVRGDVARIVGEWRKAGGQ
jgi:hypothetical protein